MVRRGCLSSSGQSSPPRKEIAQFLSGKAGSLRDLEEANLWSRIHLPLPRSVTLSPWGRWLPRHLLWDNAMARDGLANSLCREPRCCWACATLKGTKHASFLRTRLKSTSCSILLVALCHWGFLSCGNSHIIETQHASCLIAPINTSTERCLLDESKGRGSAALEILRLASGSDAWFQWKDHFHCSRTVIGCPPS